MSEPLPIELGWPIAGNTGWGLFGLHLALGLARQGRRVHIPSGPLTGIPAPLHATVQAMMEPGDLAEHRIRFDPYGNHAPTMTPVPNRTRVLLAVFEDPAAAIPERFAPYDLVLAPSAWVRSVLMTQGIQSALWHQGSNEHLFFPAGRLRPKDGRFLIFSGGKLEQRKAQDVALAAFREFLKTPEGDGAVLVTAWQNAWPSTMEGIWNAGHVKGVPAMRNGQLDMASWAEANGVPRSSFIDLGMLSQEASAAALRECDLAIFPNRCEGATNLVAVEALMSGIPCIIGDWCGQSDIAHPHWCMPLRERAPVTVPCKLYQSMDGWVEPSVEECVDAMRIARQATVDLYSNLLTAGDVRLVYGWDYQTQILHQLLTQLPA